MNIKKWFYPIAMLCCLASVSAQETNDLKNFPTQISIVHPVGTHGRQSINHVYNLSLNLLTGKVGGVKGVGVSGLYERVESSVSGIQTSGLANLVGGQVKGIQTSGIVNIVNGRTIGIQTAGVANLVNNGMKGIQTSGVVSIANVGMKGIQTSGIINMVNNQMSGIQLSGIVNTVNGETKGIQASGLANITNGEMKGIQVSGFNLVNGGMKGLHVSGIANLVNGGMKGIQVSGIANLVSDEMKGIQIAGIGNGFSNMTGLQIGGIYNRVNTLRGLQVGLVSVNDTIAKGISLSLVNIVKRGFYKEWEFSFSDYANVALSYKMGMQKFYTIYTAGVNFIEDNLWIVGLGFGNRTPIGNRFDFQPELISFNYFPTNFKDIQNTFATRLKFGLVYRLNEKYSLSLAPSVYVMTAQKDNNPNSEFYKISPLGALYTNESDNKQTTIGVGISIGLSIR
jgi:hypothetical protein